MTDKVWEHHPAEASAAKHSFSDGSEGSPECIRQPRAGGGCVVQPREHAALEAGEVRAAARESPVARGNIQIRYISC